MANREENLKNINDELENLSDEELENVSGATHSQTVRDGFFMSALLKGTADAPEKPKYYSALLGILHYYGVDEKAVKKAWNVFGIDFTDHLIGSNDYVVKDTGKKLTQAQAWTRASKLMGRE